MLKWIFRREIEECNAIRARRIEDVSAGIQDDARQGIARVARADLAAADLREQD